MGEYREHIAPDERALLDAFRELRGASTDIARWKFLAKYARAKANEIEELYRVQFTLGAVHVHIHHTDLGKRIRDCAEKEGVSSSGLVYEFIKEGLTRLEGE